MKILFGEKFEMQSKCDKTYIIARKRSPLLYMSASSLLSKYSIYDRITHLAVYDMEMQ